MSNLTTLQDILAKTSSLGKVILVTGNFNVLHPGHIRLLRFAKECGDTLIVGVNSNSIAKPLDSLDEQHRLEVLASLEHVDYGFVNYQECNELIEQLKPWAVVKGKEYEGVFNLERKALDQYGGKLIFSSGDSGSSSRSYLKVTSSTKDVQVERLNGYLGRKNIDLKRVNQIIEGFGDKKVLVIGDTIVDQYIQCNAVGMSQEDPTIVVTPDESKYFLGGAGIVAGHAKSMGASSVSYYSVMGFDRQAEFAKIRLQEYGIELEVEHDDTRPTNLKTRYRVGNKTMLRVNEVRSHDISKEIQSQILAKLRSSLSDFDILLFSDFNYGMLPQELVDEIVELTKSNNIIVAADSQSSSQVGDIARFKGMDLITPTEREVRIALKNDKDGLVVLGQKLTEVSNCKNLFVTLAEEGIFIHEPLKNSWENDRISALAANPVDPAGAGDCLFAASVMALASGATIWEAAFIGSVAAACQVTNVGNLPLESLRLKLAIEQFS
ncbi:PfkB family carbohydrate kinase [Paraglaciecola sp.]|uniref:PfkB family carbohydrate kinase n=1 Tax=Paraglaciecola sp. TaxID=1920173 RepID=UPI003EF9ECF7